MSKNSVKAKIPSKNWGQMHCDDACSITSKIIALQFVLHIVFQVNMGFRSRDSWKLQGGPFVVERCISLLEWNTLCKKAIEVQLEMETSGKGWGGTTEMLDVSHTWAKDITYQASNFRELMVVLKSLQSFKQPLQGKVVQVLSDNIAAVAYINNLSGPNPVMMSIMKAIITHVHQQGIMLSAKYLAGSQNGHGTDYPASEVCTCGNCILTCSRYCKSMGTAYRQHVYF